jgi:cytochrome c5
MAFGQFRVKPACLLSIGLLAILAACGQSSDTSSVTSAPAEQPAAAEAASTAPANSASPYSAPADSNAGSQVYRQTCAFCHDQGIAGAPRVGDDVVWGPRLAQGMDALYASAIRGKGAMPARGGNPALADADIEAAVDYILAQSR